MSNEFSLIDLIEYFEDSNLEPDSNVISLADGELLADIIKYKEMLSNENTAD